MPAGSILQVVIGLVFVLGLVACAAWLLKRFSGLPGIGSGVIRIVGGAALGQRERIVLVEIGGTWLVVGVAPGQVRALHTMPRVESAVTSGMPTDPGFAGWLRTMMERQKRD